jgi:hypothetical protein
MIARHPPSRFVGVVAIASVLVVIAATGGASPAVSRSFATCTPVALVPAILNHQSQGIGVGSCDAGAPSWNYTVRLSNRAGNILTQASGGPVTGSSTVTTAVVTCTGAIVHSFLFINVGGVGKSDTSGEANNGNPC